MSKSAPTDRTCVGGSQASDEPGAVETARAERPRRPRVALRVAFAVVLISGMICGWSAMGRQKARGQSEAIAAVERFGGRVYFDYQWGDGQPVEGGKPPEAVWVRRLVGDEFYDRVVAVDLRSVAQPDETATWLVLMPYLRHIDARGTNASDRLLAALIRVPRLEHVDLAGTRVTDAGVGSLSKLRQLKYLSLSGTAVSDQGLAPLASLRRLRHLDLSTTTISAAAVDRLHAALPKCQITME